MIYPPFFLENMNAPFYFLLGDLVKQTQNLNERAGTKCWDFYGQIAD